MRILVPCEYLPRNFICPANYKSLSDAVQKTTTHYIFLNILPKFYSLTI